MGVGWRSTTLKLAEQTCPRALDFYEAGTPYPREIYPVGTSAHAILEDIGKASVSEGRTLLTEEAEEVSRVTCERLIATGRGFEGSTEPPLPSAKVWAGRDLAMSYVKDFPLSPAWHYEEGLAVAEGWRPCPYGEGAWYRAKIDAYGREESNNWLEGREEDGAALVVTDFKSGWNENGQTLGIQQKGQGVLAWDRFGADYDYLIVTIVNFRLRKPFSWTVYPNDPEGAVVLAQWRADVESEIRAREVQKGPDGRRPASPGACCLRCPYLGQCDAAASELSAVYGTDDPAQLVRSYAVNEAFRETFKALAQEATDDGPVEVPGGLVGTIAKEQRALLPSAPQVLADTWRRKTHPPDLEAAMAALPGLFIGMGLGVQSAENLLKHLYKGGAEERAMRVKILAQIVGTKVARSFGVHLTEE